MWLRPLHPQLDYLTLIIQAHRVRCHAGLHCVYASKLMSAFRGKADIGWRHFIARGRYERSEIRAALDRHWAASDANDFEAEHSIYRDDAVLEYPQSGERIRG